jgi:hypothetical protein
MLARLRLYFSRSPCSLLYSLLVIRTCCFDGSDAMADQKLGKPSSTLGGFRGVKLFLATVQAITVTSLLEQTRSLGYLLLLTVHSPRATRGSAKNQKVPGDAFEVQALWRSTTFSAYHYPFRVRLFIVLAKLPMDHPISYSLILVKSHPTYHGLISLRLWCVSSDGFRLIQTVADGITV